MALVGCCRGAADRLAPFSASVHRLTNLPEQRQAGLCRVPIRRRDLRLGQSHEAVAALQRVIEKVNS